MKLAHWLPRNGRSVSRLLVGLAAVAAGSAGATEPVNKGQVTVEEDGTLHLAPLTVPPSSFLTPEGKAHLAYHLKSMKNPRSKLLPEGGELPFFMIPYLDAANRMFEVNVEDTRIAGVPALIYTPKAGIKPQNKDRVLLNLHGGGFMGCYPGCAKLESMPLSAIGGYKVITIDYRQGPKHKFPAASEDVASVYRELLKTYRPKQIGIYGCSAGGILVGMSLAWFEKEKLPMPGAAGVYCAGMTLAEVAFGGDANFTSAPFGEAQMPSEPPPPKGAGLPPIPYYADVPFDDPLAAPANSLELLAKFPPTQFITGNRAFDFSSAIYSHGRMVKAGAEAELHVWDGLFHGFFMNPAVPESQDAFVVMIKFFDKHLAP
jgi:acetyl esterase/lipase